MRKMIISCILFVIFSCLGNTLLAATSTKKKDEAIVKMVAEHNKTADDEDKIICKRIKVTDTRISKRICKTRKQIRREREEAQQELDRTTIRSTHNNSMGK